MVLEVRVRQCRNMHYNFGYFSDSVKGKCWLIRKSFFKMIILLLTEWRGSKIFSIKDVPTQ